MRSAAFVNVPDEPRLSPSLVREKYALFKIYTRGVPSPAPAGYTRPLMTIKEKQLFLNQAADKEYYLFLEHDATNELCTVHQTEKGVRLKQTHKFTDIFN